MVTKIGKTLTAVITVLLFSVQSISPAVAFNIGEERKVGEKLLYSVRSSFDLIDDPDITAYITDVGQSVVAVAGIQYFDYHFFVIDSKDFNAFAAPSGLIFFYSGLIESMNSEDELVSVIAHEIGHIVKRHIAARLEKSKYTSMTTLGLALAAIAFGGAAAPALLTGALATGQSMTLHFSRQNEEEADLLAYGWMKKLHRDTEGQERMLESMRRIARYRSDALPQYLLTHPNPESRLDTIQSLIELDKDSYEPDESSKDEFNFLRFKYRVLSRATTSMSLRANLASILANESSSELQRDMANYGMAQIARSENNYSSARNTLNDLLLKYPKKNNLLSDVGVLEYEAGNFVEAEKILQTVLGVNTSDMYAIYYLGLLYQKTARLDLAIKQFEILEKELPQYANVYFSLGQIYSNIKEDALAQFYLGKYNLYEGKIKLAHQNFRVAMRGKSLDESKREEAEKLLERIEDLKE
ncbi:M48 family metalloprotease [Desulforhopalus sp. 52FAK]